MPRNRQHKYGGGYQVRSSLSISRRVVWYSHMSIIGVGWIVFAARCAGSLVLRSCYYLSSTARRRCRRPTHLRHVEKIEEMECTGQNSTTQESFAFGRPLSWWYVSIAMLE